MEDKDIKKLKSKYWTIVLYPENLIDDWKDKLIEIGLPMAYCLHNRTKVGTEDRKEHIHLIIACSNTTTYNHIMNMFSCINKSDTEKAFNTIQIVYNMDSAYKYLIHDTDDCRKKGKELYDKSERICINNFDIGAYVQKSIDEQEDMIEEIADIICTECISNFIDLRMYVKSNFDKEYLRILRKNNGYFERLTRGNYQKGHINV